MARSEVARSEEYNQGAESQLNRKSAAFTPRQHECFVNVRAPQPLPNLLNHARCGDAFDRQPLHERQRSFWIAHDSLGIRGR
jgi:hypothetical protein